jgi:hypothetical protein
MALRSGLDPKSSDFVRNADAMRALVSDLKEKFSQVAGGGGEASRKRHTARGKMLARERVEEGEFIEIFVDTPIEECRRRDPKGLYAKADAGTIRNFTGIDAPYEPPLDPEIRLATLDATPDDLAQRIVDDLEARGVID